MRQVAQEVTAAANSEVPKSGKMGVVHRQDTSKFSMDICRYIHMYIYGNIYVYICIYGNVLYTI